MLHDICMKIAKLEHAERKRIGEPVGGYSRLSSSHVWGSCGRRTGQEFGAAERHVGLTNTTAPPINRRGNYCGAQALIFLRITLCL